MAISPILSQFKLQNKQIHGDVSVRASFSPSSSSISSILSLCCIHPLQCIFCAIYCAIMTSLFTMLRYVITPYNDYPQLLGLLLKLLNGDLAWSTRREVLKEYFPLSLVLQGIFKILQDLFGLRFEEIVGAEVWHDDVRVFSVFDLSSGELMGYAYLDLYSREEKYGQTCVLPLQNGSLSTNAARQVPIVLLMTELLKENIDSPAVLRFSEVVSLFHEFGHVAHHLCNHSSLARFSGLRVDHDFMEISGHMFENWCYESSILKLISGYYQDNLEQETVKWCHEILRNSSTAIRVLKSALNAVDDGHPGLQDST